MLINELIYVQNFQVVVHLAVVEVVAAVVLVIMVVVRW
jgi:hypothetical protein